ncbi:hypothetical protein ZOSMA_15G00710 [Zostera marina]|uniref:BP28 C-terminal domain-containing protein n=1 Tax=Zostera marina TaxID=29655 RepID=A0A0K9PUM2_ZOSMR|nr:hypothetical protein ZOSMA_15G00710 [Zostera marina]
MQFRLTLPPLLKIYSDALESGDASLALVFEMLVAAIGVMDKSSIVTYHTKIFEQCLLALDLRHEHPKSIKIIDGVEKNVIHAIVTLTLRLTESMFRPLFLQSLEWAESEVVEHDSLALRSVNRNISFYNLVNKMAEEQRSLFVPYFKYLIDGSTRYLTEQDNDSNSLSQKHKKRKINGDIKLKNGSLSPEKWHLRALILNSLYKCFLYDTGNLKFLNATNFQLVADPPTMEDQLSDIPTVEEVDLILVCCLGQMAVAVGSDDIWKQLNHDVLMQTRSEKLRPRILGLKVVKFLMEHLKEEYLVLLPETIPFLGELLEDSEHIVKSLAQSVFKELESISGENLRRYL